MNRVFTKFAAVLLCVSMLVSFAVIFSSCNTNKEKTEEMTVIVENGKSSYSLVRADNMEQTLLPTVLKLHNAIMDSSGCSINIKTDWIRNEEEHDKNAKEILIGKTNRPESVEVLEELKPNSWAVVNKGNKIVICATGDTLLPLAVKWFIENCINEKDKTVKVAKDLFNVDGFGDDLPISIDGVSNYQIVYPKGNENLEYIASLVQRRTQMGEHKLAVVSDDKKEIDYEIVIGNTSRGETVSFSGQYDYSIITKDSKIYINAANEDVLYYAVNYYVEQGMTVSDGIISAPSDYTKNATLENYFSKEWEINLPYMEKGKISPAYNIGTGLADDSEKDTIFDSYEHVVSNVKFEYFENYAKKLESFGFNKIYSSRTDENDLWCYRLGGAYAYMHYCPRLKCARIIWDKSSNSEISDIEYVEEQTGTTTFYQYSLDYVNAKLNYSGYGANCGMLYLVKLQDNSLIMIDSGGGGNSQSSEKSLQGLYDFLYDITNTSDNKALTIRLWYFTHPDGDHNGLFNSLIKYIKDKNLKLPQIESICFNYPSARANGKVNKTSASYEMIANINANYPDIKYVKLHTGMVFNIGELKFEVLGTVENLVEANGTIDPSYDTNDTCSLVRFHFGGKSVLMTGDIGNNIGSVNWYTSLYSPDYLKSDILQVSHHGYNLITKLNLYCAPEYAVIPNSAEYLSTRKEKYEYYLELVDPSKLHYAGNYTAAFEVANEQIKFVRIRRYDYPG